MPRPILTRRPMPIRRLIRIRSPIRSLIRSLISSLITTPTSPSTRRITMTLRVKSLIAATALATLSATCAYAGGSDQYGSWNDGAFAGGAGSQISNSQINTQTNWSNLNGMIDTIAGDAVVQGAAGGN